MLRIKSGGSCPIALGFSELLVRDILSLVIGSVDC